MSEVILLALLALLVYLGISWVLIFLIDRMTATSGPGQATWLKNKKIRWTLIVLLAIALMMATAILALSLFRMH